jgi:hypothetical protein
MAQTPAPLSLTVTDHMSLHRGAFHSHAVENSAAPINKKQVGIPLVLSNGKAETGAAGAEVGVPISARTLVGLVLSAGICWFGWQWDATMNGPSRTAGSVGDTRGVRSGVSRLGREGLRIDRRRYSSPNTQHASAALRS